ncbi:hypothetical protein LY78DRAFT_730245, partial [Colletotrichum sublineola]
STGRTGNWNYPAHDKGSCGLILIYSWWYNVSIRSSAFSLSAGTSTSRLRAKTVAIGWASLNSLTSCGSLLYFTRLNPIRPTWVLNLPLALVGCVLPHFFTSGTSGLKPVTAALMKS